MFKPNLAVQVMSLQIYSTGITSVWTFIHLYSILVHCPWNVRKNVLAWNVVQWLRHILIYNQTKCFFMEII